MDKAGSKYMLAVADDLAETRFRQPTTQPRGFFPSGLANCPNRQENTS